MGELMTLKSKIMLKNKIQYIHEDWRRRNNYSKGKPFELPDSIPIYNDSDYKPGTKKNNE